MGEVRSCIHFCVIFLCIQIGIAKPFFGFLVCDLFCDDDDITTTTVSSEDDYDWCFDCPVRRPRTTTRPPPPGAPPGMMPGQPFNFVIPPANGMNFSWTQNGNGWGFNFIPWGATPGSPGGSTSGATPAGTTAAGDATTAAATTAAPTTAAAR